MKILRCFFFNTGNQNLDPEAEGLNIPRTTLPHGPRVALSNSSGFGGANVVLAFKANADAGVAFVR